MNNLNPTAIAKAGRLVLVDTGSYSDYHVLGIFRVLKDFNPKEEVDKFLAEQLKKSFDIFTDHEDEFVAYLLARGLLEEMDHDGLYLNLYVYGNGTRCIYERNVKPGWTND